MGLRGVARGVLALALGMIGALGYVLGTAMLGPTPAHAHTPRASGHAASSISSGHVLSSSPFGHVVSTTSSRHAAVPGSAGQMASSSPTGQVTSAKPSGQVISSGPSGRVVLIGVPGLRWDDLSAGGTPHLWALVGKGSSASMSTRAYPRPDHVSTCPVAGWLTVSAGQRAGSAEVECAPPPAPVVAADGRTATVPGWAELASFNAATSYRAAIGTLGQAVRDAGGTVAAAGPGAALAAADKSGKVDRYADSIAGLGDLTPYTLVIADIDSLTRASITNTPPSSTTSPTPTAAPATSRAQPVATPAAPGDAAWRAAVGEADRRVGEVLGKVPSGATVLVAGLSDASSSARLHVAIAAGPSPDERPYGKGHLTANSTRQDALVTVTDVTTTVLDTLKVNAPPGTVGRPWRPGGAAPDTVSDTVRDLADADLASRVLVEVRGPFFAVFVAVQVLFYGVAAFAVRRRKGGPRVLLATQVMGVAGGAVAISTFLAQLVPWWSLSHPMAALIGTIMCIAGLLTALAFAGPWRRHVLGPLTVVAGVTSLALLADVMTGSRLQVNAVTGYEPVTGGRFYGFSNIAFAVYATGTILALAGVAQGLIARGRRGLALVVCLAYGLLAIFADGWPGWGADFGGVPGFVLGFAVFMMLLSGRRVTVGRLAVVGGAGLLLIGVIAFADRMRPAEQRTHLGAFAQQVIDGEALPVVGRKLGAMLGITIGNWQLSLLSLVALAFLYFVLARPSRWGASALSLAYERAPILRAGLFGSLTTALAGFLLNDSGIAIPAMALTVAVPLTLAASMRAVLLSTATSTPLPSAPASAAPRLEPDPAPDSPKPSPSA
ncbi:hypothetical protein Ssi03_26560 [Sphaerisporangium siamense]|uniref:Uncharacterized protein n=1 Tax=Sphaerisporangium siamense TaxID=795645 RepID=A0A7W7D4F5_9ACTN|nr:hypothetical protein [Sphaerisporangium siamense]MBB4700017.1 hypothetical protein [Sphaerisporangium siamense]GII84666.1 hypothetical protein Ssi03_26560 [Sphaerisporangium siamense]